MNTLTFLNKLGFYPKDNTLGVYSKIYQEDYSIEINTTKNSIYFGGKIKIYDKDSQNITKPEDLVVLECVNRLLETGYKPENIQLEKIYPSGHGTSGRLDICVNREDGSEFLLIECKTYGKEFDKEFNKIKKDGGQLFTYFKFSNKADLLMLYASELSDEEIIYKNEIIKIEEDYRIGDVKDFYDKWSKLTKDNGVFDSWVKPYNFESKALTPLMLNPIKQEDSGFIFNRFLEILRHNVVSDKPNAFNKIFTLFLCKVYDEKTTKENEELKFQWLEGKDTDKGTEAYQTFLLRLSDLYKSGMLEFLEKEITDFSEVDFEKKYKNLDNDVKKELLKEFNKIRLEKNNEFAIKEVFDKQSFIENGKIIKAVVELLQGFRIRYNKRQQYLSDFFELLLTTGLKQESGQFFTPVPIAQFIIKSLPIDKFIDEKLEKGERNNLLPFVIDYASGSGHFLTESMHEIQRQLDKKLPNEFISDTAKKIKTWQDDHFDWATQYVYGIEKDYRLVKVGKVGCYLHGDGLANVILSDGLGNFQNTKEYKGLLNLTDNNFPNENKQFDILISNPPYSVPAFKNASREYYNENDFELYKYLTDNSSEIESLFIERAKQLLKDGGVAGIILPSSILTTTGIYTKSREIILKYFDIVAITELGPNTFMATDVKTVILFLKRRDNYISINTVKSIERFFTNYQDVTINGIEKPISNYVNYVWKDINFEDYLSLIQNKPNENILKSELYKEYKSNIKLKKKNIKDQLTEFSEKILEIEVEKLLYFILSYNQKIVLIKSGKDDEEKRFLGFKFSNRRGNEGIHPIQSGKNIEDCTKLFDPEKFDNPGKASTYIYKAFQRDYNFPIDEELKDNITRHNLIDMLTFDRVEFEKIISLSIKKKVKVESKWDIVKLEDIIERLESGKRPKGGVSEYQEGVPSLGGEHINLNGTISLQNMKFVPVSYFNNAKQGILQDLDILICKDGALTGKTSLFIKKDCPFEKAMINEHVFILRSNEKSNQKFLFNILYSKFGQELLKINITGTAQGGLNRENLLNIQIPLPPLEIQEKIVSEIGVLEEKEKKAKETVEKGKKEILNLFNNLELKANKILRFSDESIFSVKIGNRILKNEFVENGKIPVYSANVNEPFGNIDKLLFEDFDKPSVIWGIDGDWMVNYIPKDKPFYPTDHCGVLRVKDGSINEKYLAYILEKEGKLLEFSRTKRASIDRIQGIKIPVPSIEEQKRIMAEIEKIEEKMKLLEQEIAEIPKQKEEILKKYL